MTFITANHIEQLLNLNKVLDHMLSKLQFISIEPLQARAGLQPGSARLLAAAAGHLSSSSAPGGRRHFTSTRRAGIKEFFPEHDSPSIRQTPAAWPHPVYTEQQMNAVVVAHREAKTWADWSALTAVRLLRRGLDLATGYRHRPGFVMTERKYMIRNVFLESVAGVPGMVAGMLRHLHSMRRMKRDNGW